MQPYPIQGEYPAVPGNKFWSPADITGPALYAPIVVATPPTGGQVVTASQFGLQNLEKVWEGTSDNGAYKVIAFLDPYLDGRPAPQVRLMWITAATGAEAAAIDLSGRTVRLWAIGQ